MINTKIIDMTKSTCQFNLLVSLILLLAFQGCMKGSSEYDHGINEADKIFVKQGLHLHDIMASACALVPERSDSNDLKTFASNTRNEQLQLYRELDSVNNFIGLKIKAEPTPASIELNYNLVTQHGRMFDSAYLHAMLIYHQKALEIYNSQLADGSNKSLKNYTGKKIDFLKGRLQAVELLYKRYH